MTEQTEGADVLGTRRKLSKSDSMTPISLAAAAAAFFYLLHRIAVLEHRLEMSIVVQQSMQARLDEVTK